MDFHLKQKPAELIILVKFVNRNYEYLWICLLLNAKLQYLNCITRNIKICIGEKSAIPQSRNPGVCKIILAVDVVIVMINDEI